MRSRVLLLGVVAVFAASAVVAGNRPLDSDALLPSPVDQTIRARNTRPGDVVHFAFSEFEVTTAVRVTAVELLGKRDALEVVDVLYMPLGNGPQWLFDRDRSFLRERDLRPISDMVIPPGDDEFMRHLAIVGVRAIEPGMYETEGLRVHYESRGRPGVQDFDWRIGLEIVPADE